MAGSSHLSQKTIVDPFDPAAWYHPSRPDEPIYQGAQFFNATLRQVVPDPNRPGQYAIGIHEADVIVATQSCDLQQRKVSEVEIIPVYPLTEWLFYEPAFFSQLELVRRGHVPGLYLLPAWPRAPYHQAQVTRIVAFDEKRSLTWADLDLLRQGGWLGLGSPYIEHFGQALARFYMRVGLPEDLPAISWQSVGGERPVMETLAPTDERIAAAGLPLPSKPLIVTIQKLQLTHGPDVLVKAASKQDGSLVGVGRSSNEAISSLLRRLAMSSS